MKIDENLYNPWTEKATCREQGQVNLNDSFLNNKKKKKEKDHKKRYTQSDIKI